MPEVPLSDAVFANFVQICCAFAQGAGHLHVENDAILQAREDYAGPLERGLERWEVEGPRALEAARAMGALAAHQALHDGVVTITRAHYQAARTTIHQRAFCPFRHHY